ncbi:MAG: hypothetical protein JWM98_3173 [Thermoleophilia bacterium]|nr:hypothetical protein [Thermoleophilia bacterium]
MGVPATTTGSPASVTQVPPTASTTAGGTPAAPVATTAPTANARAGAATTDYATRLRSATSFDAKNAVFFDAARKDPADRPELWKTYFASLAPSDQKGVLRYFAAVSHPAATSTHARPATPHARTTTAHPAHGRSTRTRQAGATTRPARTTTPAHTPRQRPASGGARSAPSPRPTPARANPGPTPQERADLDRITSPNRFDSAPRPAPAGPSQADLDRVAREAAGGGHVPNPLPAVGRKLRGAYRFFQKN